MSLKTKLQERISGGELARVVGRKPVPWPANFLEHLQKVADIGISTAMQNEIAEKITRGTLIELFALYDDVRRCGDIPSILHSMLPKKLEQKLEPKEE